MNAHLKTLAPEGPVIPTSIQRAQRRCQYPHVRPLAAIAETATQATRLLRRKMGNFKALLAQLGTLQADLPDLEGRGASSRFLSRTAEQA